MSIIYIVHIHSGSNNGICTGHYFPVADMYYRLLSPTNPVVIAGGDLYTKHFPDYSILQLPHTISLYASTWITLLKMFSNAFFLFKRTKDNIVVLQDGKPLATYLCILLFYKKCDLYLIKYSLDINSKFKRFFYSIIKNRIKGIICPNEEIGKAYGQPYCVVPDYIYTGSEKAFSLNGYCTKKYDFCCLGRIEPEKGIVEVVKKLKGTPYSLLVAGNPNPSQLASELQEICKDAPNVELRLGYLCDEDYEKALTASRYAILNYHGVYANRSSGVVFDMLFHGVPIVGHKSAALNFVAENEVGYLFDDISEFNPSEILNEEEHSLYLSKIKEYCQKNVAYKNKLVIFLGI